MILPLVRGHAGHRRRERRVLSEAQRGLYDKRRCGQNPGGFDPVANRKYTPEEKKAALKKFDQTQSATKTVRALGYPGRWTLHKWLRERNTTKPKPFRHEKLTHYPFVAEKFGLRSKMSVYSWAQTYRDKGEWALMTKRERAERAGFPTRASLEASFPDDVDELKRQLAKLTVEKALVDKELELVKKRREPHSRRAE